MADKIQVNERVYVRVAQLDDIPEIAIRGRKPDEDEVWALNKMTLAEAMLFGFHASDICITACLDDRPALMFGCGQTSVLTGVACPWMLGTNDIDKHPKLFWKCSVDWTRDLSARYEILRNFVDERNEKSMRWLSRLGFLIGPPVRMGYEGRPFRMFEMRRTA